MAGTAIAGVVGFSVGGKLGWVFYFILFYFILIFFNFDFRVVLGFCSGGGGASAEFLRWWRFDF